MTSSTSSESGFVEEDTESIKDVTNLSINDFDNFSWKLRSLLSANGRHELQKYRHEFIAAQLGGSELLFLSALQTG